MYDSYFLRKNLNRYFTDSTIVIEWSVFVGFIFIFNAKFESTQVLLHNGFLSFSLVRSELGTFIWFQAFSMTLRYLAALRPAMKGDYYKNTLYTFN